MAGPVIFFTTIAFTLVLSAAFATWLVRGFHIWWVERQPNLPFVCYALGMILVVGPRLEGHSGIFLAIQTHLSCRFFLAVDSLGLRRGGSSSQFIDPPQKFPKQAPRHGNLGQLERDIAILL